MKKCERVAELVCRTNQMYKTWNCYLYVRQPTLLLRGYALDMTASSCYVWKFIFPLYTTFVTVDLNFAYRLDGSYVSTIGLADSDIADRVSALIDQDIGFSALENALELARFVEDDRIPINTKRQAIEAVELYISSDDEQLAATAAENRRRLKLT